MLQLSNTEKPRRCHHGKVHWGSVGPWSRGQTRPVMSFTSVFTNSLPDLYGQLSLLIKCVRLVTPLISLFCGLGWGGLLCMPDHIVLIARALTECVKRQRSEWHYLCFNTGISIVETALICCFVFFQTHQAHDYADYFIKTKALRDDLDLICFLDINSLVFSFSSINDNQAIL